MTLEREKLLRTSQRKMLRMILGTGRRVGIKPDDNSSSSRTSDGDGSSVIVEEEDDEKQLMEPWLDFIRRTTHSAVEAAEAAKVKDWILLQRERKWRWAGHVARRTDGRWTKKLLEWKPEGRRSPGRPQTRWEHTLTKFVSRRLAFIESGWKDLAAHRGSWELLAEDFGNFTSAESNARLLQEA